MALLVRVVEPGPKQPLHELEEEVEVLLVRGRAEHNRFNSARLWSVRFPTFSLSAARNAAEPDGGLRCIGSLGDHFVLVVSACGLLGDHTGSDSSFISTSPSSSSRSSVCSSVCFSVSFCPSSKKSSPKKRGGRSSSP